jgi:hypothetical protein
VGCPQHLYTAIYCHVCRQDIARHALWPVSVPNVHTIFGATYPDIQSCCRFTITGERLCAGSLNALVNITFGAMPDRIQFTDRCDA